MGGREEYLAPSPTSSSSSTRSAHQSPYFDPLDTSYRPYESGNTQSWTHERPPQNKFYPQKQPPSPTGSLSMGQMRLPIRPPQRPSLQDRVEAPTVQFILVSLAVLDFLLAQSLIYLLMFELGGKIEARTPYYETIKLSGGASVYWLILAWLSIAIEGYCFLDWLVRVMAWGSDFLTSFWNFFDSLIVLGILPAKLLLPTRITLMISILILLRSWRIMRAVEYIRSKDKADFDFMMMEIIKDKNMRLEEERTRAAMERARWSIANHKLEKLLGVEEIEDYKSAL